MTKASNEPPPKSTPTPSPEPTSKPDSLPTTLTVLSVIAVADIAIGLLVYFKKRKH